MKINIYPSFCRVDGSYEELVWLKDLLAIDVPGAKYTKFYKRRRWDGKKRFFTIPSKAFPVGLLGYVLKNGKTQKFEIIDQRRFPVFDSVIPDLHTIDLRDYQKQAILQCLEHKNCMIEAATNAGKTAIFSGLIKKIYPHPTLILTHRDELLKQTVQYIERYTGLECGFITSKDTLIKPVTVGMIQTLTNRIGADQEITDFFESLQCIITDEAHHQRANTYGSLLASSKAPLRFGFSGTIPEEDTYEGILTRAYVGSVVFKISNSELIESNVSAKPHVYFYEIDLSNALRKVFDQAKLELESTIGEYTGAQLLKKVYTLSIKLGVVQNESRSIKAVETVQANPNSSTLIIVDLLEHGEIVQSLFEKNGIESVFIHGQAEERASALQDFKDGKLKVLISSNILDEGVDISRIENLVMLAGKKSRRQILQRVGRSLRRKEGENVVKIYDFLDIGSKYLTKHAKQRYQIYKAEGFEIDFI